MKKCLFTIIVILSVIILGCSDKSTNPNNTINIETVNIGTQVWMKKNLNVGHYRNGDSIPLVTDPAEWVKLTTGAWCYYNNDSTNGTIYGKLYNWYAVYDSRGLAPVGWHIPTDEEWTELENYLGGSTNAGSKMKTTGTIEGGDGLWYSPNRGANNQSGFSALPGGWCDNGEAFSGIGYYSHWWSATASSATNALGRLLSYNYFNITICNYFKESGFSVRCVRD